MRIASPGPALLFSALLDISTSLATISSQVFSWHQKDSSITRTQSYRRSRSYLVFPVRINSNSPDSLTDYLYNGFNVSLV